MRARRRRNTAVLVLVATVLALCWTATSWTAVSPNVADARPEPVSGGPVATELTRAQERQLSGVWFDAYIGCLRDAGLTTVELPDGGVDTDLGELTWSEYDDLRSDCVADVGPPPVPAPVTAAEARQLYEWDLDTRTCLIIHGFTVTDPSPESAYVAHYLAGTPPWNVYQGIVDISWAQQMCPQRVLGET